MRDKRIAEKWIDNTSDQETSTGPLGITGPLIMNDDDAGIPGLGLILNFWTITEALCNVVIGRSVVSANVENSGHLVRGC